MSKGYKNPAHRKGKLKIAFNPLEKRSLVLKGMQIDIGLSLPPGASGIRQSSERLLVRTRELSGTAGGRMNRYYPPPTPQVFGRKDAPVTQEPSQGGGAFRYSHLVELRRRTVVLGPRCGRSQRRVGREPTCPFVGANQSNCGTPKQWHSAAKMKKEAHSERTRNKLQGKQ